MTAPKLPRERRRIWVGLIAGAWLVMALPCWVLCMGMFMNWASNGGLPDRVCGEYPCGILAARAMIYGIIPVGVIAAIVTLVGLWVTAPPDE